MNPETEARQNRDSFLKVFRCDDGEVVLRYLAGFARADEAEYCADPRKDAYLQGRRSVVLEIRRILKGRTEEE